MYLDLTASFTHVTTPTPFGIYDSDTSFQTDANGMVRFTYAKLGGNVLNVEIRNKDVYSSFEEATLEYSAMVNSYHAKSVLADLIASETGSLDGNQNKIPQMNLALQKKRASAYSSEVTVGGTKTLYSASVALSSGIQNYNLDYVLSASGLETGSINVEIKDVYHFSPTAAYRFFDSTSAVNYLHNEFSFESFTPETVFYMLPVWEDVLRAQQLELSHRVRRSNYSYNVVNNQLKIFPVPTLDTNLYFTYYRNDQPAFDPDDPITNGVSNLSNVPFGNISYSKLNSLGKQWIRKMAMALTKEILGQIRGKSSEIPIPNGALTLNGADLLAQAREEQGALREELKALLEATTYQALAAGLTEEADNLQKQLSKVPLPIFIG